ncbi:PEP-CTERM sorting domain-containing protein [Pseudoduganella flava]|nr:PEP-CTERM sorting domain-containing protein [Pseudoduganella flava]
MQHFNFEFRGFWDANSNYWSPDQTLGGTFAGDDRNADQQISQDELTSLVVNGRDYYSCPTPTPQAGCGISYFAYQPGDVIKLHVWEYHYSYEFSAVIDYQTLDPAQAFMNEGYLAEEHGVIMNWMPTLGTSYFLVPTVPEPSMIAMSLLGLGLLGTLRKRRRSRQPVCQETLGDA